MAALGYISGGKQRLGLFAVCGYTLIVVLWQLRSSMTPPKRGVSLRETYLMRSSLKHIYDRNAKPLLDIHILNPPARGELLGGYYDSPSPERNRTVAIGGGITSARLIGLNTANIATKFPLFKQLLPSFCKTASVDYDYHFYLAYDHKDPFLTKTKNMMAFQEAFFKCVEVNCLGGLKERTHLHLVSCDHSAKPAWAQNDAMMEAYKDDIEYYFRLNDDTQMLNAGWLEAFLDILKTYDPPLVGVVGPGHTGGNTDILTYDFVHKSHVTIFGFYYPRRFTDWWADNWMTSVYKPRRSTKLDNVQLNHTMELGQRYPRIYRIDYDTAKRQIEADKKTLLRYLQHRKHKDLAHLVPGKRVLSMTLYGQNPRYHMGVIRNAQLAPLFLPGWTLRVYVAHPNNNNNNNTHLYIPQRILHKLRSLNVQIAFLDPNLVQLPPCMWNMLVADDLEVDHVLVRDATYRPSDREVAAVNFWLQTDRSFLSLKDHPSHTEAQVVAGLWGARPRDLLQILGGSVYSTLQTSLAIEEGQLHRRVVSRRDVQNVLAKGLWPKVRSRTLTLDSVSCQKSKQSFPFPVKRFHKEYVGQAYDEHERSVDPPARIPSPDACVKVGLKPDNIPPLPELDVPMLKPLGLKDSGRH